MLTDHEDSIPQMPTHRADGFAIARPKSHLHLVSFVTVWEGQQIYSLADIDHAKKIHQFLGETIEKAEAHVREISDS